VESVLIRDVLKQNHQDRPLLWRDQLSVFGEHGQGGAGIEVSVFQVEHQALKDRAKSFPRTPKTVARSFGTFPANLMIHGPFSRKWKCRTPPTGRLSPRQGVPPQPLRKSSSAAAERDFSAALHFALLRYEIFRDGDQLDFLAETKSDLGFWYAAAGCEEKATILTLQAQNIIFRLKDESRFKYNLINWQLILRLQGYHPNEQTIGDIRQWATIRKDSRVEFFLNLALSIDPTEENSYELCHENFERK